tara:strand:- start:183 stop:419 length:237 start_codon:yes stop_codon:yes gene_type:complete
LDLTMSADLDVYRRSDGKWAWRLTAPNGNIIATDGSQGYENRGDCESIARGVATGAYRTATLTITSINQSNPHRPTDF